MSEEDLVLASVVVTLPKPPPSDDPDAPPPEYDIALVDGEGAVRGALPLQANGKTARPLKGLRSPTLSIQIRAVGAEEAVPLFASPPLEELARRASEARAEADQARADGAANADELRANAREVASKAFVGPAGRLLALELPKWGESGAEEPAAKAPAKGGKGAPPEDASSVVSVSAVWRFQAAVPTVGKPLPGATVPISMRVLTAAAEYGGGERHRIRPLATRYTAPRDLVAFESRLNGWRAELSDNLKIPPEQWPPFAAAEAVESNNIPSAAPRSAVRGGIAEWPPQIWSHKWRAPYVPHHMRGDALSKRAAEEYISARPRPRAPARLSASTPASHALEPSLTSGRAPTRALSRVLSRVQRIARHTASSSTGRGRRSSSIGSSSSCRCA